MNESTKAPSVEGGRPAPAAVKTKKLEKKKTAVVKSDGTAPKASAAKASAANGEADCSLCEGLRMPAGVSSKCRGCRRTIPSA